MEAIQSEEKWTMSVPEAVRVTGLSRSTIYRAVGRGEHMGAIKIGKSIRFRKDLFWTWFNSHTITGSPTAEGQLATAM